MFLDCFKSKKVIILIFLFFLKLKAWRFFFFYNLLLLLLIHRFYYRKFILSQSILLFPKHNINLHNILIIYNVTIINSRLWSIVLFSKLFNLSILFYKATQVFKLSSNRTKILKKRPILKDEIKIFFAKLFSWIEIWFES